MHVLVTVKKQIVDTFNDNYYFAILCTLFCNNNNILYSTLFNLGCSYMTLYIKIGLGVL